MTSASNGRSSVLSNTNARWRFRAVPVMHTTGSIQLGPSTLRKVPLNCVCQYLLPMLHHLEDQSVKKGGEREQVTYGWDER